MRELKQVSIQFFETGYVPTNTKSRTTMHTLPKDASLAGYRSATIPLSHVHLRPPIHEKDSQKRMAYAHNLTKSDKPLLF